MIASRSPSERPPQIPYGSCTARACERHSSSTGHAWQIAFARASRRALAGPRSPSGWKKNALSMPRQEASRCQSHTSALGPGSLRVSAMVTAFLAGNSYEPATPFGAAKPPLEPRQAFFEGDRLIDQPVQPIETEGGRSVFVDPVAGRG